MRMAASGEFSAAQIAAQVGCSRRQLFNWVRAFQAGGVAGLLYREHKGRPKPQITGKVLEEFQTGLQTGRWKRAKKIQHWLEQQHQVTLKLSGVYYWLGKLGAVMKVPRKARAKQDAS
jgi:transposase